MTSRHFVQLWTILLVLGLGSTAGAYPLYEDNTTPLNDCAQCHGGFRAFPYFSLSDGQVWSDDLHDVHRQSMLSFDCDTCHQGSFSPVALNASTGGIGFPAIGCVGCHGRVEDRGTTPDDCVDSQSAGPCGDGAGLRQHHFNAGETDCAGCHADAIPSLFTPVGENVLPPYYSMPDPDPAHPNKPTDSCNPAGEEDYAGSPLGLDNDGDLAYDTNDADCDGAVEECFDGADNDGDDLIDCLDPDCDGAIDGPCDTGDPGICATGTFQCLDLTEVCVPDSVPEAEGPFGDLTCEDTLDNDCDGLTDIDDPDCAALPEDCWDGVDNDGDDLIDCADPDCEGAVDGDCDTGVPGVCAAGTLVCSGGQEVCEPNEPAGTEGPPGDPTCEDGLDNDCDALTDIDDPDCQAPPEECFDGIDNDGDGLVDCADPDCEGAVDGACDTGFPGICSEGTLMCSGGLPVCEPNNAPGDEGPPGDPSCEDGLDNDCDGLTDIDDPACQAPPEDCFDGVDNDGDQLVDCADPDCEGARDGPCDTGDPGVCAAGTRVCSGGAEVCEQDEPAGQEGPPGDPSCEDGLDNDCDGLTDIDDPACQAPPEDCFDGVDNDLDDLIDCADPDCDGAVNGSCDTGAPGICAAGTRVCSGGAEVCEQNEPAGQEGPPGDPSCQDGLDNDCDGLTDMDDPACQAPPEDCWDGVDNDGDGMVDCADPDCEGARNGPCDTGLPGVCAAGTLVCSGGAPICEQDEPAGTEGPAGDRTCQDGIDNDCDGLVDVDDPDCEPGVGADVWLEKLKIPHSLHLQASAGGKKRIYIIGDGDTFRQDATVTVSVDPISEVSVAIQSPSSTKRVGPGRGSTKFRTAITVTCNDVGNFKLNWTAMITAAENRDPTNDTVTGETNVHCR